MSVTGRSKLLRYLEEPYRDRPGSQVIRSLNRNLAQAGLSPYRHQQSSFMRRAGVAMDKAGLVRNLFQLSGKAYLVSLMWPRPARLFPISCFYEVIPLCFDCWPGDYDKWGRLFRRNRIHTALFTARDSASYFENSGMEMSCFWAPEAADPADYRPGRPLADREIDVLELGRRFEQFHTSVTEPLVRMGHTHVYSTDKQSGSDIASKLERYIFHSTEELLDGLGNTRISICFSKALTHPDQAGTVDTATFRYFESIASNCLIVGHCPSELRELFGYSPIVEVDMSDPARQLHEMIVNIAAYQKFVDDNYRRFLEVGTCDVRARSILDLLSRHGYMP